MEHVLTHFAVALRRVGAEAAVAAGPPAGYAVAGPVPLATIRPRDEAGIGAVVSVARDAGLALLVRGAGSCDRAGGVLRAAPVVVLDTTACAGLVAYAPGDLTVRVRPGTRLSDLDAVLAARGQMLGTGRPSGGATTVGGLLGADAWGPSRLRWGGARDAVLGMRCVDGAGRAFAAGANVVKNVSGLDVGKLMVGSFGTLAVLTEVCLRLRPRPRASALRGAAFGSDATALAAARAVLDADFVPTAIAVADGACLVAVDGGPADVADQAERLAALDGWSRPLPAEAAEAAWRAAADPAAAAGAEGVAVRCDVPEGALAALMAEGAVLAPAARLTAWAGLGVLWVVLESAPAGSLTPDRVADVVRGVRAAAEAGGGRAVVAAAPEGVRAAVPPFGDPGALLPWLSAVKHGFDPDGVLAPGRFVGGL